MSATGFYGKLPCKGDFLQRRVPQEFVDAWDAWLQQAIHDSRGQLQERWLDTYLTGPVWRFVFAEGVCGTGAYAGVMLPSVDRVGRYFPLTVLSQWNVDACPLEGASGAQPWFAAAEALALAALDAPDLDLEAFDDQVAQLDAHLDAAALAESVYLRDLMQQAEFAIRPSSWHVPLSSAHSVSRAVNVFAYRELQRTLRPLALWWTEGSNALGPSWLCTRGLPDPRGFVAMISGEWTASGWTSLGTSAPVQAESLQLEPAPESSAPPIEIGAWHEPVARERGAPGSSNAHFVSRPDLGLWGVASNGADGAQALVDGLQDVPQVGTLTALVQEVRRTLDAVNRYLAGSPAGAVATGTSSSVRSIVFLARGEECALVYAGDVQAVRCRSSQATAIVGVETRLDTGPDELAPEPVSAEPGSLMDLLAAAPATAAATEILVRYETLRAGDAWMIASDALFDTTHLAGLAAAVSNPDEAALSAVRATCGAAGSAPGGPLPLMLLAAQSVWGG